MGNKTDLESERRVKYEDGQLLAMKYEIPFIECSAKDGNNICRGCVDNILESIFEELGTSLKEKLEKEELEIEKENENRDVQYL